MKNKDLVILSELPNVKIITDGPTIVDSTGIYADIDSSVTRENIRTGKWQAVLVVFDKAAFYKKKKSDAEIH